MISWNQTLIAKIFFSKIDYLSSNIPNSQRNYSLFGGKTTVKKIAIRRPHLSIGGKGGQRGVVEDHTFTFFGPFP